MITLRQGGGGAARARLTLKEILLLRDDVFSCDMSFDICTKRRATEPG